VTDLHRALADIHLIRDQLARGAQFRGYGPTTLAATGVLALLTSAAQVHSSLAMQMIHSALEQFLPAIVAGLLLTVVLLRCAPQNVWMLPGLWQVLFSMAVFASCRFLPRQIFAVGVWYLAAGLTCLALGGARAFSPWAMGLPFGIGQLLVASVLQFGYRNENANDS
jgi:hypothetical protein